MMIIGCDLHPSWQQVSWMDTETGETGEKKLVHATGDAKTFYQQLEAPVLIGVEATGNSQWFVELVEDLGHAIEGHPEDSHAPLEINLQRQLDNSRISRRNNLTKISISSEMIGIEEIGMIEGIEEFRTEFNTLGLRNFERTPNGQVEIVATGAT